jgi:membrane peptidoglycan carboxypeptidase
MAPVRFVAAIATLARTGIVVGVVLAALVYPLAAVGGLGVKRGAEQVSGGLEHLQIAPLSQVSKVYAADGQTLITQFYEEYRIPISIEAMSPHMQHAIVAAEDARFFEHDGVDVRGIARAFVANQQAGGVSQGASTITMQYVRMSLRDSAQTPTEVYAATERTPARKLKEMRLAVDLEKQLTKSQILERYLNAAYFGHRAYGIQAAAEVYFSKPPADLTVGEAAMLAGLVQAPSAYDPASSDPTAARARRDYVIGRMVELGYLTAADAYLAQTEPIRLKLYEPPNDCVDVPRASNDWGFFCDLFKSWWMARPEYGGSPLERLDRLRRGGYTVVTTLDVRTQAAAFRQVSSREPIGSAYALGLVGVEPGSGRVRAMAVNRVYSLDQSGNGRHTDPQRSRLGVRGNYPATVNPLLGGGDLPGYQAGSTFKLFTLLAALERGMPLATEINSPQRYQSRFKTEANSPTRCNGLWWCPVNASKAMTGRHTMWAGFGKSVNTFFVQLEERVGPEAAVQMAERLGLRWHTDIDRTQASPAKARTWGAFTLGVADTTPLEMAGAYATVAADGVYCAPLPVSTVALGADGAGPVPVQPTCGRAVSVDVARAALDAARCVTGYQAATGSCGGWSTAPGVYRTVGRPVAGKTGTTDDNRSVWFIGMTPLLTVAGFIADPDNPFHVVSAGNRTEPREATAGMLREALIGTPVLGFNPPAQYIVGKAAKAKKPRPPRHCSPACIVR